MYFIGLILYYGASTLVWGKVVARILPLSRAWSRIFGFLLGFYLSALAAGIPVVLWKYNRALTAGALLLVLAVGWILSFRAKRGIPYTAQINSIRDPSTPPPKSSGGVGRDDNMWQFLLFGILSVIFLWLLARGRTGDYILSPWDVLSPAVLAVFFILVFLVVRLIFSKQPVKIVLAIIIVLSYLTHLYLPLVYQAGFGGDRWRHLGAERWLASGQTSAPAKHAIVWGDEKGLARILGVDKISYTPMWTITIFLSDSLGVDVFWIDLFLIFLLWSFFLPLILYQFGRLTYPSPFHLRQGYGGQVQGEGGVRVGEERGEQLALLLAFLPILFANFQTEGAITLPTSFGHLFFFFILLLWAYFVKTGRRSTLALAGILTVFSYWGYILNFIVLIIIGLLALFFRLVRKHTLAPIFIICAMAASLIIPLMEVGQGLSKWGINSFPLARFVNFIYHPSDSISILSIIISVLAWLAVCLGLHKIFRSHQKQKPALFLAIVFIVILASYFISWTFTQGEHILARRLPETIVFLVILFLGWGIMELHNKINRRWVITVVGLALALAATSTYSSGPVSELVTSDQLASAKLIWSEIKDTDPPYCIIANTWPLLAVESVSGERIIGGGFPIIAPNYQQPERVRIFKGLSANPKMEWFDEAFSVTRASTCYYMNEPRWLNRIAASNTTYLLGQPRRVGKVYVWEVSKK